MAHKVDALSAIRAIKEFKTNGTWSGNDQGLECAVAAFDALSRQLESSRPMPASVNPDFLKKDVYTRK